MVRDNRRGNHKGFKIEHKKSKITIILMMVIIGVMPYINETKWFETLAGTVTNMGLTGTVGTDGDSIQLNWKEPNQTEPYTYKIFSKKPGATEYQSISSTDLNKEVKVLNLYPKSTPTITYTTWDGKVRENVQKSSSAEMWMEKPNSENPKGYGMGIIDVDPVKLEDFNVDPEGTMKNEDGTWKYDVVFFGTWDSNGDGGTIINSPTQYGLDLIKDFLGDGRGVLLGHDTMHGNFPNQTSVNRFTQLREIFNVKLRVFEGYGTTWWDLRDGNKDFVYGQKIQVKRKGLLTSYPWNIGDLGTELTVPDTHTTGQIAMGDVWMDFGVNEQTIKDPVTGKGTNNYYLTTWNNTAQIQTGHSNGNATPDEQKVLANTLFYLAQMTTGTDIIDRSAMEVYPPVFKGKEVNVTRDDKKIMVDFPDAEDVQSTFDYYVEATGQDSGNKLISETKKVTNTSGLSGYSYVNDSNPTTVPDNIVDTTTSNIEIPLGAPQPKYVHVVAVDKKGNKSEPIHITLDNTPPKLEITKGTEGWTKNEVIYTIKVSDEESGINSLTIPERGVYTYKGDKNPTSTYGTYTTNGKRVIVVEDMAGNRTEAEINVNNIDKDLPGLTVDYTPKGWTNKNVEITATGKDAISGIRNVRMETDRTSKNILPLADLQAFGVTGLVREGYGYQYSTDGTQRYEGLTVSDKLTEPNEWYVMSFDITKLSGTIPHIGGHSHIASESKVYIDGKLVNTGSHIAWDTSVPYPNDNKKHHVTVVFYTGNYNTAGDKKLYIQPTRRDIGYPYEVKIENVQLEKGKEETPYEPNYLDILKETNPLKVSVTENGVYSFITTDNAGNEYKEDIEINKIDKIPPKVVSVDNNSLVWTGSSMTIFLTAEDKESGMSHIISPDGEVRYSDNFTYTVDKNGEYDFTIVDRAGNETVHTVNVTKIDKDKPTLEVNYVPDGWTNGNIEINAKGKDNGSGVKNVRMTTEMNSKNVVSLADVKVWHGKEVVTKPNGYQFKSADSTRYGGFYIPASKIEPDEHYVLSFDIEKISGNIEYLGGHAHNSTIKKVEVDGKEVTGANWNIGMAYPNDTKKHRVAIYYYTDKYYNTGDKNIYVQPNRLTYLHDYEVAFSNIQFEKGTEVSQYEPNYKDLLEDSDELVLNISENGEYTFTATDNVGNETTKSVNITTIDKEAPDVEVIGNPTTYVDEATIVLDATDNLSGVKSITLPTGEVVTGSQASFKVNENGTYEFTITDNAGNTTKETVEVSKMTIPYMFYLYDAFGKPIKGSGFDLLRDGEKFTSSISDENGLVDFGRVPGDGKYTIKQTKAPDGYVIDPNEKDVEVGDTTEPEEFINYPRGTILPATGTIYGLVTTALVGLTLGTLYVVSKKKRNGTGKKE